MKRYNPKEIEPRWQKKWAEDKVYEAGDALDKPKKYILEYFPYPSGAAMHVGHVRNYTIGDAISRYNRMRGFDVLHPMGWDAFGLPAENYAIKTGISPQEAVAKNVTRFKQQLTQMGFGYDWSREINSTDPDYYKWTQWFFLLLHKRGLAYQAESNQWWCPVDKTVLANEQVENGQCWRCGSVVEKKALKQWFFKITDYANRLEKDLDDVDWSDSIKHMQRNWIGRSQGAEIDFAVDGTDKQIKIFTTRPDTLYGATFMVLAPEHPLAPEITTEDHKDRVHTYIKAAQAKSDIERQETEREKTGVFTGAYAINPVNDEKIPIWVADYVLYGYGTGAIMAVPAHDERDWEFARKFDLPIRTVYAEDFGKRLPDPVNVEGAVVVGYDPAIKQFMSIKADNRTWLVGGGREGNESFEDTARRELAEEAGFDKIVKLIPLGSPVYSYYFNDKKESNRRSFGHNYLVILEQSAQGQTAQELHEKFTVQWSDYDTLMAELVKTGGGVDHWMDALAKAKQAVDAFERDEEYIAPCVHGEGIMIDSGPYDGLRTAEARDKIVADLEAGGKAKERINYKIRDWLISRQRYWGAPIPMIHCQKCGTVPVPEDQLPVVLPEMESYEPSGDGRSPLARVSDWVNVSCPNCDGPAQRETDTMDGFACSSWYFLRFADPHNSDKPFDPEQVTHWLPVDDYIGGAEHAVMHLLYARFWTKVMQDEGLIDFSEPFKTLRNQGMILAPDGQKMSKSKGNTIEPDGLIEQGYGADAIRVMELFIGPWNQMAAWSVEGMGGSFRFLQRVWALTQGVAEHSSTEESEDLQRVIHRTIKKVTDDLESLSFNTAVAAMMEAVNDLYKLKVRTPLSKNAIETLLKLLAPFAPHITEELWAQLGHKTSIHTSEWPTYDDRYLVSDTMTIVVQINGKVRAQLTVATDATEQQVIEAAKTDQKVAGYLDGKDIKKTIYIPNKLVSFVVG